MRKSTWYLIFTTLNLGLFVLMALHGRTAGRTDAPARAGMVGELHLTDLCLFTEARYTRHPSMADLHAPFQDHPLALEHFPSGSLVSTPNLPARRYEQHP